MLNYNTDKYNFDLIEQSILNHYRFTDALVEGDLYFGYPANDKWKEIIREKSKNIFFERIWSPLESAISNELERKVISTTFHAEPSYSGCVILEEMVTNDFVRIKKVYFLVSLLGPFYTIIGADESTVNIDNRSYQSTNLLVVSPLAEYKNAFEIIDKLILTAFGQLKFVPYFILSQSLKGFRSDGFTIMEALFHNILLNHIVTTESHGDKTFGGNAWLVSTTGASQWIARPPLSFL